MTDHSRRATLRTATGTQIEHAGQNTVEYENSVRGSVNVSFEVADVTMRLVAVGELQKRGMTVVMGPHGSFVTRGHVTKPPGSNLDLEHSNGACWLCLTRGENGTSTAAPVDLGDAVPTSENLSDLPTVEATIDVAREDAEANVPLAVPSPKEPGAAERARYELTHMPHRSWCFSCVAGRGSGRRSSKVRRLHRTSKSGMRFHVSVEPSASREPQADHLQHDGQGKPVSGCSSHCEGRK